MLFWSSGWTTRVVPVGDVSILLVLTSPKGVVDWIAASRSVAGQESPVQLLCCGHGLATSSSTSAWQGWSGGQKHMRSWPVSSPMSASSGEPGSHSRYSCTASALVRTPGVLPTSNGLPHLCGRATEMAPSGLHPAFGAPSAGLA